jgi:REP element-mobilizing transposase RayT
MPSRNREKDYVPDSYYHVYNRGLNKGDIFKDDRDYAVFLSLLKRYLGSEIIKDKNYHVYESLRDRVELAAFCLMPNHFHLLIYQHDSTGMTDLLRRACTAYVSYFNKRYGRSGPLFQERFKASRITKDEYLQHISRYIHLNPPNYRSWEFSSLPYYLGTKHADWVRPKRILELFDGGEYPQFLEDYEENKKIIDDIKLELANSSEL